MDLFLNKVLVKKHENKILFSQIDQLWRFSTFQKWALKYNNNKKKLGPTTGTSRSSIIGSIGNIMVLLLVWIISNSTWQKSEPYWSFDQEALEIIFWSQWFILDNFDYPQISRTAPPPEDRPYRRRTGPTADTLSNLLFIHRRQSFHLRIIPIFFINWYLKL